MCDTAGAEALSDCLRISRTVIQSDEGISGSIKSVDRMIDRIYRVMIAVYSSGFAEPLLMLKPGFPVAQLLASV